MRPEHKTRPLQGAGFRSRPKQWGTIGIYLKRVVVVVGTVAAVMIGTGVGGVYLSTEELPTVESYRREYWPIFGSDRRHVLSL